ncbi:unannotated protein [freshwater metagenome]|uniref:Unannotated protein n=1 Tax=freshwater metagenome TaxID=449393 RepID=A0A6J6S8I5_9ZZZZ
MSARLHESGDDCIKVCLRMRTEVIDEFELDLPKLRHDIVRCVEDDDLVIDKFNERHSVAVVQDLRRA